MKNLLFAVIALAALAAGPVSEAIAKPKNQGCASVPPPRNPFALPCGRETK